MNPKYSLELGHILSMTMKVLSYLHRYATARSWEARSQVLTTYLHAKSITMIRVVLLQNVESSIDSWLYVACPDFLSPRTPIMSTNLSTLFSVGCESSTSTKSDLLILSRWPTVTRNISTIEMIFLLVHIYLAAYRNNMKIRF